MRALSLLLRGGFTVPCLLAGLAVTGWGEEEAAAPPLLITPSKDVTHALGPVDSEGYVDFYAATNAVFAKGVSTSDNAAIPLLQAMGPCENRVDTVNRVLQELGQPEWTAGSIDFQNQNQFLGEGASVEAKQAFLAACTQAGDVAWVETDHPQVAALLKANAAPLQAIAVAVQRPKYYRPLVRNNPQALMIEALLPDVQEYRDVARQLEMRAMLHLGHQRLDEALQDLETMHRLARHISQGSTLIEGLVGIAINSMAFNLGNRWALAEQQTPERIARYRTLLAALPPFGTVSQRVDTTERYSGLDLAQALARGRGANSLDLAESASHDSAEETLQVSRQQLVNLFMGMSVEWSVVMRTLNQNYDELVKITASQNRSQQLQLQRQFDARLAAKQQETKTVKGIVTNVFGGGKARGSSMGNVLAGTLSPALNSVREAYDRIAMRQLAFDAFLAAVQFRLQHDQYPATFEELTPEFIPSTPQDIYASAPFRLVTNTDRTTIKIYSVGANGRDDAGRTFGDPQGADDLIYADPAP